MVFEDVLRVVDTLRWLDVDRRVEALESVDVLEAEAVKRVVERNCVVRREVVERREVAIGVVRDAVVDDARRLPGLVVFSFALVDWIAIEVLVYGDEPGELLRDVVEGEGFGPMEVLDVFVR